MTRHLLGLYSHQPGANAWRRYLSEHAHYLEAGVEVIEKAISIAAASTGINWGVSTEFIEPTELTEFTPIIF